MAENAHSTTAPAAHPIPRASARDTADAGFRSVLGRRHVPGRIPRFRAAAGADFAHIAERLVPLIRRERGVQRCVEMLEMHQLLPERREALDRIVARMQRRIERWVRRLLGEPPTDPRLASLKAETYLAMAEAGWVGTGYALTDELALSVARGVPRSMSKDADRLLLDLGVQWEANARLLDVADAEEDALLTRFVRPEPPMQVYAKRSDPSSVQACGVKEYRGRLWYGFKGAIDKLHHVHLVNAYGDPQSPEPDRCSEIIAAYHAWQDRIEAAEAASGLARAKARAAKLRRENERLRRLIILSPASTMQGVFVKMRIVRWCLGDAETYAADNEEAFKEQPYGDHLVVSAAADLIRMVDALGAYVRPAEVAELARAA